MSETYRSHGKLLLTGEYAVLDGAEALGLPTRLGQELKIAAGDGEGLTWKSLDHKNKTWFETEFLLSELSPDKKDTSGGDIRNTLLRLLREAVRLNPGFLKKTRGARATSTLEFPRNWGLGSSSTLISNLALWAEVDPYTLLWNAFTGSGYDIACARASGPLIYRLENKIAIAEPVAFDPLFKDRLFFIHLNRKQNSREAISYYKKNAANREGFLQQVSAITRAVSQCTDWDEFNSLLLQHEELLSDTLQVPRIQEQLFPDFHGLIKSLGAWGGDFVLATGHGDVPAYFKEKGYTTILPYTDLVL